MDCSEIDVPYLFESKSPSMLKPHPEFLIPFFVKKKKKKKKKKNVKRFIDNRHLQNLKNKIK